MSKKYKFYYHILRGAISRKLFSRAKFNRTENLVKEQYSGNYGTETNNDFMFRKKKMFVEGKLSVWPVIDHKIFLLKNFAEKIGRFKPESILELGSGRGFNLLTLAVLLPELRIIRGVELTPEGVNIAKQNIANPPLEILSQLTGFNQSEVCKRLSARDIDVVEGSIRKIPFSDNMFDVVFSNSVIEQIPDDYLTVFKEAARVASKGAVFSEPFCEAQQNWLDRLYLKNIDYFRASYKDVERAGWRALSFEVPKIQKFVFNTGFLTVIKSGIEKTKMLG